ncbi:MAG: radical SAM family heme chaperone HemW [Proteobacteria bacterium]|nr:radical SAM family heme chaperone HemW [Pseudomonadota bacterium]
MILNTTLIPLSLYIHLPWCIRKCPYCDFNSHEIPEEIPEKAYIDRLIEDLTQELPLVPRRVIQTIFFGGGTPSLFSGEAIHQLLDKIQMLIPFSPSVEITLEANPGTVEAKRFRDFRAAGINRLSIGVQSFDDQQLKRLGRIHDSRQAMKAIEVAHTVGFNSFNIDLMYATPHQTVAMALDDIEKGIQLSPHHLSWYQFTLEPNTVFYKNPPVLPTENIMEEIETHGKALLNSYGFQQYEISAYAKPHYSCCHNINYWEFGDYLGIGAGAHGKITLDETQTIIRTRKVKQPKDYLDPTKQMLAEQKTLTESELIFEFMLNALRLKKTTPFSLFETRTGLSKQLLLEKLNLANEKGLLTYDDLSFCPTPLGWQFLNDLTGIFL